MRSLLVFAIVLTSCASALPTGPYVSSLSSDDIRQIKLAVSRQPHTDHWIRRFVVVRPDKVDIDVGHFDSPMGMSGTTLYVIKRGGRWIVDPTTGGSWGERTIVTD